MSVDNELQQALDDGLYVRLELEDESHEGFVVGLSPAFVLLQSIYEWQDYGAHIFPRGLVRGCEVSDFHDDQQKIIAFNSVKRTKRYTWVNLTNFSELFRSLKPKNKFVVVSIDDEADVGQIDAIHKEGLELKAVDPGGNWIDEVIECPFEDITSVQFDDNYSRVLQRYVERAATLN